MSNERMTTEQITALVAETRNLPDAFTVENDAIDFEPLCSAIEQLQATLVERSAAQSCPVHGPNCMGNTAGCVPSQKEPTWDEARKAVRDRRREGVIARCIELACEESNKEIADARRTAEYWKAEHIAGNNALDAAQKEVERLRGILNQMLSHDGGPGSQDYDAHLFVEARVAAMKAVQKTPEAQIDQA